MPKMKAAIFIEPGRIILDEKPIPDIGPLDALIRITTTTICGTDVHILKGEYPVARGLTIGHEPVGVIEKLGSAVRGYREGQKVIAGAITPSGYSEACLCGCHSQDGAGTTHRWKPLGGWRFGNTTDGCQAEYVLVPDAMANLAPIPDGLTDEQVLMCPDIMSTGFAGAESGGIHLGADHVVDFRRVDAVREILRLTGDRGVDVAIEALGTQATFEGCLRVLRPGGTLSSLGVYSSDLRIPLDAFAAGLGRARTASSWQIAGATVRRRGSGRQGGGLELGRDGDLQHLEIIGVVEH